MEKLTVGRSDGRTVGLVLVLLGIVVGQLRAQDTSAIRFVGDSVSVRFIDTAADAHGSAPTLRVALPHSWARSLPAGGWKMSP